MNSKESDSKLHEGCHENVIDMTKFAESRMEAIGQEEEFENQVVGEALVDYFRYYALEGIAPHEAPSIFRDKGKND